MKDVYEVDVELDGVTYGVAYTRVNFKTNHWSGSFQAGDVQKFSNKAV
jgi:hypothetical protein